MGSEAGAFPAAAVASSSDSTLLSRYNICRTQVPCEAAVALYIVLARGPSRHTITRTAVVLHILESFRRAVRRG